ncbi:hypothetical protein SAMN04489732_107164 [Amycolatopsis saalfeldensis]|uniref:Peptidase inhibitor family I36 n=1 Tax=Amycolatopsis saalfeldensis TaxID=394193 RepID=A0A1H8XFG2_9PSEU|nr:hypothetical protein SAMN04489732_107164 [Amycolatopsis saalfeldensis]
MRYSARCSWPGGRHRAGGTAGGEPGGAQVVEPAVVQVELGAGVVVTVVQADVAARAGPPPAPRHGKRTGPGPSIHLGAGNWNDHTSSYRNNQTGHATAVFSNWNGSAFVTVRTSTAVENQPNLSSLHIDNIIDGVQVC